MTRIVGGSARGRRLKVPSVGTRPTSDRVREALFSSLDSVRALRGARVLDLYAGTGALGLEALSRGALAVVLVDSSANAARVLHDNAKTVGLPGVTVRKQSCAGFLRDDPTPFDLVFLDPPYDLPNAVVEHDLAALGRGWLAARARVVVERSAASAPISWPPDADEDWQRRFGDTRLQRAVWYGQQVPPT